MKNTMNGMIADGGKAANIVPEKAAAQFYVRANDRLYLDNVVERVYNVARGAALATGAKDITRQRKIVSADFSSVTYRVPSACLRVAFISPDTASHSAVWASAAKSEAAYEAILVGAKAIAGSCYELFRNAELRAQIKQEFASALEENSRS